MISKEIVGCNIFKCSVNTNCPKGGDGGHGGFTIFKLENEGSTGWEITVDEQITINPTLLEITLSGDSECETFAEALDFGALILKMLQKKNKEDKQ